ncbi:MAG: type II secretion system ATPase GspE [Cystobacterineae bacterium]|nr:type II secretion system ATPase GspE [Cystobacterineae bacterium]
MNPPPLPSALASPPGPPLAQGSSLGEILQAEYGVPGELVSQALLLQKDKGQFLGEILLEMKAIAPEQLGRALSIQLGYPFLEELSKNTVDYELVKLIPINFAKQAVLVPLHKEGDKIAIAVANPLDFSALDQARLCLNSALNIYIATPNTIVDAINLSFERSMNAAEEVVDEMEAQDLDMVGHELEETQDLLDAGDEAPIIRLVNSLLFRAAKERASDIHIEPMEQGVTIRFRVDGVLQEIIKTPKRYQNSILSRIKIMARLNIAEKRLPQDGRIRIRLAGRDIDIRVSVIPTAFGERIVMRLLDKSGTILDLSEIGMGPSILGPIDEAIRRSHGIILVTGPTGSGKTTTLYGALNRLNTPDVNILTVEDPVEYQLPGIGQMAIQPKIGLTFAAGLRSFLRQDPDIIMVGEIRDRETAQIAIEASLTGHLVLSTVHTNDSAGAVIRLVEMGIEPFLVASSLTTVLAQRLVRRLCTECRIAYEPTEEEVAKLGVSLENFLMLSQNKPIYKASSCSTCNKSGYRGRTGIYELLLVDDEIRQIVLKSTDSSAIKKRAILNGMTTLLDDGTAKVAMGETSIAEVLSVTQEDT